MCLLPCDALGSHMCCTCYPKPLGFIQLHHSLCQRFITEPWNALLCSFNQQHYSNLLCADGYEGDWHNPCGGRAVTASEGCPSCC